jgi:hypothetical protein
MELAPNIPILAGTKASGDHMYYSSSSKILPPSPQTPVTPELPRFPKTYQMERLPAHPQTPQDGQIPGCAVTLPATHNTGLYQDYEQRNTEILDGAENTPLSPLITRGMIRSNK